MPPYAYCPGWWRTEKEGPASPRFFAAPLPLPALPLCLPSIADRKIRFTGKRIFLSYRPARAVQAPQEPTRPDRSKERRPYHDKGE